MLMTDGRSVVRFGMMLIQCKNGSGTTTIKCGSAAVKLLLLLLFGEPS